jgi:hypothetical protein
MMSEMTDLAGNAVQREQEREERRRLIRVHDELHREALAMAASG